MSEEEILEEYLWLNYREEMLTFSKEDMDKMRVAVEKTYGFQSYQVRRLWNLLMRDLKSMMEELIKLIFGGR